MFEGVALVLVGGSSSMEQLLGPDSVSNRQSGHHRDASRWPY
jgi:hypothetical protein